jgi:hypothetical protein
MKIPETNTLITARHFDRLSPSPNSHPLHDVDTVLNPVDWSLPNFEEAQKRLGESHKEEKVKLNGD